MEKGDERPVRKTATDVIHCYDDFKIFSSRLYLEAQTLALLRAKKAWDELEGEK